MEPDLVLMERVLGALKHDWVWDFFFASTASELDMLRHAVTSNNVSTAEMDISTLCFDPRLEIYQIGEKCRFLLLNSFSTGDITVGFAISEQICTSSVFSKERYLGRIARDDSKGTCLFIAEDFNDHLTEVSFFGLESPTQRENIFTLCHSKRLRRLMEDYKRRKLWDADCLKKSLVYFFRCKEERNCPSCGKSATSRCSCKLALRKKAHPLDTESDLANLKSYAGQYSGVADLKLMALGDTLVQGAYSSKCHMTLTMDAELKQRLGTFALREAALRQSLSPLAFRMSARGMGSSSSSHISPLDTFLLASIADSVMQDDETRPVSKTHSVSTDTDVCMFDADKEADEENSGHAAAKDSESDNPRDVVAIQRARFSSSNILAVPSPIVAPVLPVVSNPPSAPLALLAPPSSVVATAPSGEASTLAPSVMPQAKSNGPESASKGLAESSAKPGEISSAAPVVGEAQTTTQAFTPGTRSFSQFTSTSSGQVTTAGSAKIPRLDTTSTGVSSPAAMSALTYAPLAPPANDPLSGATQQRLTSAISASQAAPTSTVQKPVTLAADSSMTSNVSMGYPSPFPGIIGPPPSVGMTSGSIPRAPAPISSTPLSHLPQGSTVSRPMPSGGIPSGSDHVVPNVSERRHRPDAVGPLPRQEAVASSMGVTSITGGPNIERTGYEQAASTGQTTTGAQTQGMVGTVSNGAGSGTESALRRPRQTMAARIAPMRIQARYILPSGSMNISGGAVGGIDKSGEEMDERKRKAELRKARNRESAQRSNHKRKLMIQALKDDIAEAASQEAHLRAREKLLREENRALRKAMASK